MAEERTGEAGGTSDPEGGGVTLVVVPAAKAQAVIDFVASLQRDEADVSGHMISRSLVGGIGGQAARLMGTLTGIYTTAGSDLGYSDTDQ